MSLNQRYVASLDQGTSSTRCLIVSSTGKVVSSFQKEHEQHYPKEGWVEHDAMEIWENAQECITGALSSASPPLSAMDISAVGITNQRETTVVWSRTTGKPYANAIVWNDVRTQTIAKDLERGEGQDRLRAKTGLPLASYFSGTKLIWLMDNVPGLKDDLSSGEAMFGTIDCWLLYNLTGGAGKDGKAKGVHMTDVTNASRTLLMNISTLSWDSSLLEDLGVPPACLPEIRSSSEIYGSCTGVLEGVPVAGILGDQQAALFGQACFSPGEAKCTYGTGQFLMMNTGGSPMPSTNGLLTTVGYKIGNAPAVYAVEGAVAYCGSVIQWLRDNLRIIDDAKETEAIAERAGTNGGVYFVPAFAGLFAPHWDASARGCIVGMTAFNNSDHVVRAALEAAAYQASEVIEAMKRDSGVELKALQVDGGMTANNLLMQFQSDILNKPVSRPVIPETTALGAAYAAGLAVGVWKDFDELKGQWRLDKQFVPNMEGEVRGKYLAEWGRAVEKSKGWIVEGGGGLKTKVAAGGAGLGLKAAMVGVAGLAIGAGLGWMAAHKGKK